MKFTSEWLKTSINFLDVTMSLMEGVIEATLYVKPTKSQHYLQSSSCHPFHCKMSFKLFEKRCNELERFLLERGYSSKLVRKKKLRARKIPGNNLL